MDEQKLTAEVRRRRSPEEIQELLARFESSGLSRVEFCSAQGVSLASLARYRKRQARKEPVAGGRLVPVEVTPLRLDSENAALVAAVRGGRRIEVGRGFDVRTLAQLVGVLEGL
jgi:hypothetical protein